MMYFHEILHRLSDTIVTSPCFRFINFYLSAIKAGPRGYATNDNE